MRPIASLAAAVCALACRYAGAEPLDTIASAHYRNHGPGAAVLVERAGRVLLRKAYGMASLELDVPMRPDNVFRIGSISKTFTAVAILQLAERGALALDAPISRYLPDSPPAWAGITIEHLLVHASGIPNLEDAPDYKRFQLEAHRIDDVIAFFRHAPLQFAPGTRTQYSSSGYIVLGKVIEVVSGMDYASYVRTHITQVLGMDHTGYGDEARVIHGMASGYRSAAERAGFVSMSVPRGAGALISTTDDLARFCAGLQAGKLLSAASYARMRTPFVTSQGEISRFGTGLVLGTANGKTIYGHTGAIEGFAADLEYDPESKTTVIVLQNQDGDPGLAARVNERLMTAADHLSPSPGATE
jgi:serine beta-lactamase-like protein LACTB